MNSVLPVKETKSLFWKRCIRTFPILLALGLSMLCGQLTAQERQEITGQVFDEKGAPIAGVNVFDKNRPAVGISTDAKGTFQLSRLPPDAVLVFSMLGLQTQEIPIKGRTHVDVTMKEDLQTIDAVQVVSTGYGGVVNKRNTTAAAASIDLDDIIDIPIFQLGEALVGMVPGLDVEIKSMRPGAESVDWGIRRTYQPGDLKAKDAGDSSPLVVIDDIRTDVNALNNLDPNQIESLDILKDAAAAIYGSDGSQGVIIVRTKRGKAGKPTISYNGNFGITDAMSKFPELMNSYEYGQFWNSLNRAAYVDDPAHYFSDQELERMKDIDYNWLKKAWKPGIASRHSFSLGGGTEKVAYNAGISYQTKSENIGSFDDNNIWNFRAGVNAELARGLKADLQLQGGNTSISKQNAKNGNDFPVLLRMPRYIPWEVYDEQGNAHFVARAPNPGFTQQIKDDYNTRDLAGNNFFAMEQAGNRTENESTNFGVNMSLTYEVPFIPGLAVKGRYSRSDESKRSMEYRQSFTLLAPTNTNQEGRHLYTDIGAGENATIYHETIYSKDNMVVYNFDKDYKWQTNLYVTYNRTFGDHSIDALYSFDKAASDKRNSELRYLDALGGIFGGTSATSGNLEAENTIVTRSESGDMAYLGRINYGYRNKYFLTLVGRYDAHTKFSPENYWGFFPSVAGAWIVSDEPFFADLLRVVDFFKMRLSYGKSGQKNVQDWEWMQRYGLRQNESGLFGTNEGVQKGTGLKMSVSPNRDATWSDSHQYNIGLDTRFFRSRLSVTVDHWWKRDRNILTNRVQNLPISIGGSVAAENYGAVNSWGTEISVGWNHQINSELSYRINANWSTYNNKLIKYDRNASSATYPWDQVEGSSTRMGTWGHKIWKGTSSGDGMIRSVEDADAYWTYLQRNAEEYTRRTGKESAPNYFGITQQEEFRTKLGMLVYEDLTGPLVQDEATGRWYYEMPDGVLRDNEDKVELVKGRAEQTINTRFSVQWRNFSLSASIATSWGGWTTIDFGRLKQDRGKNSHFTENMYRFMTDMYDMEYNTGGRYPNVAHSSYNGKDSNFWSENSLTMMVRNLTLSYQVPRETAYKLGFQGLRFSLTGNNIGYIIDPLRKYGTTSANKLTMDYPTLQTRALAVNITFK